MTREIKHYPVTEIYENGDIIRGFDGQRVLISRGTHCYQYQLPLLSLAIFQRFMNGDFSIINKGLKSNV